MGGNTGAPQPTLYIPWRPTEVLRPRFAPVELQEVLAVRAQDAQVDASLPPPSSLIFVIGDLFRARLAAEPCPQQSPVPRRVAVTSIPSELDSWRLVDGFLTSRSKQTERLIRQTNVWRCGGRRSESGLLSMAIAQPLRHEICWPRAASDGVEH
jgi:hypothetical protein